MCHKLNNMNSEIYTFVQFHHASKSFRISEDDFFVINKENVHFVNELKDQYSILKRILEATPGNINVTMLSPNAVNIWQLLAVYSIKGKKLVIIDEGIGTYYSKKMWDLETRILRQGRRKNPLSNLKNIGRKIVYFTSDIKREEFKLLSTCDGELYPNEVICCNYRKYMESRMRLPGIRNIGVNTQWILASDNLSLYFTEEQSIADVYKELLEKIKNIHPNIKLIFKPHPNEKKDYEMISRLASLGFEVIETDISFEEMIAYDDFLPCGFCSTSLITSALVFDKRCICLVELLPTDHLSEYGKLKIEEFRRITKNIRNISYLS